jgi:hypothetical protein
MSRKTIGYSMLIIGILIFVVSLAADYIGLGSGSNQLGLSQIGWRQWLAAGVGFVIAVVGVFLSLQRK